MWISIKDIKKIAGEETVILLVGNKLDLEESREVSVEAAKEKAINYNIEYHETSALSNTNIDKTFNILVEKIFSKDKNKFDEESSDDYMHRSFCVGEPKATQNSKCC